ncbi:apoptosis-inducing factor 2 [Rhypophila decipiens]
MGSLADSAPFRILVIGGSYGGLSAALNLQDLCRGKEPRCGPAPDREHQVEQPQIPIDITIVDERDGFYHAIGGPLVLASEMYAEKAWVKYDEIPALRSPNIRVLQGSVKSVDTEEKVATFLAHGPGAEEWEIEYDYLVAAAGLRRVWPVVPKSLRKKEYLLETGDHTRDALAGRHGVVVVGGGAVGVEIASELKHLHPETKVTLVQSRDKLLSAEPLPEEFKDIALDLVRETGVNVLLSHRLDRTDEARDDDGVDCYKVHFTNGHTMLADQVVMAVSKSVPSTDFLPQFALDEEGYVLVESTLQFVDSSPNASSHFAIGDLAKWSGIKRCGAAMHMGYYAANNIFMSMVEENGIELPVIDKPREVLKLDEIPPMMGLAVGQKAISYWPEAGVNSGEDVMKSFFGDDLAFSICWNHMRLGTLDPETTVDEWFGDLGLDS